MAERFSRPIRFALERERRIYWAVLAFPLVAVAVIALAKLSPRLYMFLVGEDSLVEWATALVYLVAAGFAVSLALHFRRQQEPVYGLLYGVLGAGLFLIAMEEISWGQRQLGIETPTFIEGLNVQGEVNLHNMSAFPLHQAFIAIGIYGSFSRLIATPWLAKRHPRLVDLLTPPYALTLFFLIPLAYYVYCEFLYYTEVLPRGLQWSEYWTDEHFIIGKDQEPIELILAFGFLLFTLLSWARYRIGAPLMLWESAAATPENEPGAAEKQRATSQ